MRMENRKELLRIKRHRRIRLSMQRSSSKPRLIIHRSLKNLSAQIVDDAANKTLFSLSTQDKEIKSKFASGGNIKAAEFFAQVFAKKIKEKGITNFVFDRAGYLYHGRIRVFADGLRKEGLQF